MGSPTNWRDAACRGADINVFFPGKSGNTSSAEAKKICSGCPIRAACLNEALDGGDAYAGVRGGKSAEERRAMLRGKPVRAKDDYSADIIRLTAKRWTPPAIAARYGIDTSLVYRVLKAHRDAAKDAGSAA